MKRILIVATGWLGDALFASSIAERLKNEDLYQIVDYLLGFPQTAPILAHNPFIDNIFVAVNPTPYPKFPATKYGSTGEILYYFPDLDGKPSVGNNENNFWPYDNIVTLPSTDLITTPTAQFQLACGVTKPSNKFDLSYPVETEKLRWMREFKKFNNGTPLVGIASTWKTAIESKRDPHYIASLFRESKFETVVVLGNDVDQFDGSDYVDSYTDMAQLMQVCDWVVGSEGGLLNLAAGLGVPTICTTDFTLALFGPEGRMYQRENPFDSITPPAFFKDGNHKLLHPTIDTDAAIVANILNIISR